MNQTASTPKTVKDKLNDLTALDKDYVDDYFVFGYGSLIWNPGFSYSPPAIVGYACEHIRRFHQGSRNYRGTNEWPGRVATLIPQQGGKAWGFGYRITDPASVIESMEHLIEREMIAGDYEVLKVNFHPYNPQYDQNGFPTDVPILKCICNNPPQMVNAITYVAAASSDQYLGASSIDMESYQITFASGSAGSNTEYVEKIAKFYQEKVPTGLNADPYLNEIMNYIEIFKSGDYDNLKYSNCFGDRKFNKKESTK